MWHEVRDYWLPLLLLLLALLVAAVLLVLGVAAPYVVENPFIAHPLLDLYGRDVTVQRVSIAGAIGLIVTAFVFFRPNRSVLARRSSSRKPPDDSTAGA